MNAESEGREARGENPGMAKIPRDQCPYPEGSEDAKAWTAGWNRQNEWLHEREDERRQSRAVKWAVGMGIAVPLVWAVTGQDPLSGGGYSEIGGMVVWGGLVYGTYRYVRSL